jgi:hypothetical protein
LLRVLILPLARRTVVIVVAGSRIMLATAEPIEKATRLRPGPLPVVLILLVPVPEKLGLHCHAGRLGYRQNGRHYKPTRTYSHFAKHIGRSVSIRIRPQLCRNRVKP